MTSLANLLGVIVPAWRTLEELEEGDDMGMAVVPASALDIVVSIVEVRQTPGYTHHEVVSINPPPGSLVKPGSTVTVTINLEG